MTDRTLENQLTKEFRHLGIGFDGDSPLALRKITAVGAESTNTYSHMDSSHFLVAFNALAHLGIPLHPAFKVDCLSLHLDGRDFLVTPPETDLLITCFIHNPPKSMASFFTECGEYEPAGISPLHHRPGIWAVSAQEAGARMICTHGGFIGEVGPQHFDTAPFRLVGINVGLKSRFPTRSSALMHEDYAALYERECGITPQKAANARENWRLVPSFSG